jgi:hypothetical protein
MYSSPVCSPASEVLKNQVEVASSSVEIPQLVSVVVVSGTCVDNDNKVLEYEE